MKKIKIKISGRPGWHIECSVMSQKFLKTNTLDIHAGGRDLIFPHHENEIAQAEALTGRPFAKYWLHHGLLTINGRKMAKSLGNFITIKDVLKKYPADVLKLCYLTVHYPNPIDFSWERMDIAKEELNNIKSCIARINYDIEVRKDPLYKPRGIKDKDFREKIDRLKTEFEKAMDDDFNTAQAKSVIFQIITEVYISMPGLEEIESLEYAKKTIVKLCDLLGLTSIKTREDANAYIDSKVKERNEARKAKDFKKADDIRKKLASEGVILEDTNEGTIWRKRI